MPILPQIVKKLKTTVSKIFAACWRFRNKTSPTPYSINSGYALHMGIGQWESDELRARDNEWAGAKNPALILCSFFSKTEMRPIKIMKIKDRVVKLLTRQSKWIQIALLFLISPYGGICLNEEGFWRCPK
jgi:hypothetical protein